MRLLQINKYATLNGGSEVVLDTIHQLGRIGGHDVWNIGFSKPGQKLMADSSDLGAERLHPFDMFRNSGLVRQIVDTAREFRPDLILHHNVYHHFPMAQLVSTLQRQIRVPQSIILHDLKPVCPTYLGMREGRTCEACSGNRFWNAVLHRCKNGSFAHSSIVALDSCWNARVAGVYKRFHRVISPSRFLHDTVVSMGIGCPVEILSNPCPVVRAHATTAEGIVFAGRLSEEKGIRLLLDAARQCPEIPFRIIGGGALSELVLDVSKQVGNISFLGRVPREEVVAQLASARFSLLPSICQENNPMTALESLSCGTPLLGSNIGGIPELASDGKGLLFDPFSIDSVVRTIRAAYALSEDRWQTMSACSSAWAEQNSEASYFRRLLNLITR